LVRGNNIGKNTKIGKGVSFGGNVFIFKTAPVTIGDYSMIAYDVIIHTSTHDYKSHPMWMRRIDRPVKIGKHVWIGTGSIILPGVKIGDYAVIGAGSIVTSHVPKCAIVVGCPAKIIKFRDIEMIKDREKNNNFFKDIDNIAVIKESFLDDDKICNLIEQNKI